MSATLDILRSYRSPRSVMRRRIAGDANEARAVVILIVGCGLLFIAQWPSLARMAFEDPSIPLEARLGGALFAWMFLMPLFLYALAGISRLIAVLLRGRGTHYSARMALFWALLASAPLWLFNGLVAGFIGPGPAANGTALIAGVAFLWIWGAGLWETEHRHEASG
ncbi:MAG: YIP1 family protein [Rhodobacteraceae bacterium]|nr:YIP1 family protein [Alphaproteobacteria bacterium]MBT8476182.1 YIP1 family protein [Alphaproteobacteria bacterium]NNK67247.1 YIP1 family protein [Paracoccaceae bacterium]